MNKPNNLEETKNPKNADLSKMQTTQELVWVLTDNTLPKEDSIDLAYLNATHPIFIDHEFSDSDMEYLENVKNDFLNDATFNNLQKVIGELNLDRADLAEAILLIYNKVIDPNSR